LPHPTLPRSCSPLRSHGRRCFQPIGAYGQKAFDINGIRTSVQISMRQGMRVVCVPDRKAKPCQRDLSLQASCALFCCFCYWSGFKTIISHINTLAPIIHSKVCYKMRIHSTRIRILLGTQAQCRVGNLDRARQNKTPLNVRWWVYEADRKSSGLLFTFYEHVFPLVIPS
jgi:hypothetical protein